MPGKLTLSGVDYGGETGRTSMAIADVTAVNYDQIVGTDIPALQAAINAVLVHNLDGRQVAVENVPAGAASTIQDAQRERKWLVGMSFTNNSVPGTARIELPMANADLLSGNTENLDLGAGPGLALKTALEATARSKFGDAVTVEYVKLVGRST